MSGPTTQEGDSLVGLTRRQIAEFHWQTTKKTLTFVQNDIDQRIKLATNARREIIEAGDEVPHLLKQQKLLNADESLNPVRFIGDLVIAAFFAGEKDRQRQERRDDLYGLLEAWWEKREKLELRKPLDKAVALLRAGENGVVPFHWEIEFAEVFGRANPGFDTIVGNPPFLGGTMISTHYGKHYLNCLYASCPESGDRMDLVAYFFRRAFALLRSEGALGLIATNTIAQGDTRQGGLRWICLHDGDIYSAERRYKWPGEAAVLVSVIHILKGRLPLDTHRLLDGKPGRLPRGATVARGDLAAPTNVSSTRRIWGLTIDCPAARGYHDISTSRWPLIGAFRHREWGSGWIEETSCAGPPFLREWPRC